MQLSYSQYMAPGFPGLFADGMKNDISTGFSDETVAIPFGRGMVHAAGSRDRHYRLPNATTDKLMGISGHTHGGNLTGSGAWPADAGIGPGEVFNLLKRGRIYVLCEELVVEGDVVYCRAASGSAAATDLGKGAFRKSGDALTAWAITTAYTLGQRRVNGGNVYEVITAGTSAGSGGPSGTGSDITDGTVHWKWVSAGTAAASAFLVKGAIFSAGNAAAGGLAVVEFSELLSLS